MNIVCGGSPPKSLFTSIWGKPPNRLQKGHCNLPKTIALTFLEQLVGGWTNPVEKYAQVKLDYLPQKNRGFQTPKNIWMFPKIVVFSPKIIHQKIGFETISNHPVGGFNQPIWKILYSQIGSFPPIFGMKNKQKYLKPPPPPGNSSILGGKTFPLFLELQSFTQNWATQTHQVSVSNAR